MVQQSQTHQRENHDNSAEGRYFRVDGDNKLSYKYTFTISWTWMVGLNT